MNTAQLPIPTEEMVKRYIQRFDENNAYSLSYQAVFKTFQAFPKNDKLDEVWLKVVVLNDFYNTNIYATRSVAERIHELHIDYEIEQRSLEIVDEIAQVNINGKWRRNYSFATKYCSFHLPTIYPIYDSYVDHVLWKYKREHKFSVFRRYELQNYGRYKQVIADFMRYYQLEIFDLREIDRFLWLYGKELLGQA